MPEQDGLCGGRNVNDKPVSLPKEQESQKLTPEVVVENFRIWAKPLGYAISVHGTLARDIDMVATPWTADAVSQLLLVGRLLEWSRAIVTAVNVKPRGRVGFILQGYGHKMIDLSITGFEHV